jgi:UDP-4-amino-4,6-dideoxy-N-acetyl-beta-L-altrosamine N-acetyltransferase
MNHLTQQLGRLRNIGSDELDMMLAWRNAPAVRANMYTRHEISIDEHLAWWERTQQRADQRYFMYEAEGVPLGIVGFTGMDTASKNSSWAFYASPEAPKGTGSKMEFLALEYAFNNLALHKLYCEVLAFNSAVIKLHQKFGFQIEGIFREHHRGDDGFVDVYRLGLLAPHWSENRITMLDKLVKRAEG